jgi:hypothetical protein
MSDPIETNLTHEPIAQIWQSLCNSNAIKLLLGLAVLLNIVSISSFLSKRQNQQDFAHYYASSKVWLANHQNTYRVDLVPEYEKLGWTSFDEPVTRATNPPPLLAAFSPYASLNPMLAHAAWTLTQLLALVASAFAVWKLVQTKLSKDAFYFVLSVFLIMPFLWSHFYYAQVQIVLMAMILFAYQLLPSRTNSGTESAISIRSVIACTIVVTASLVKVFPIVLLPWFIFRSSDRWTGRIIVGIISTVVLLVGIWLTDIALWRDFIEFGLATVSIWVKASYECFTLTSFSHQVGIALNQPPESDLFIRIGSIMGIGLLGVFYCRILFRRSEATRQTLNVELALLILLMLFCGSTCWWHYLVFLLFPMMVIASELSDRVRIPTLVAVFIVMLLFTNIGISIFDNEVLKLVINHRPLIGMVTMAGFLALAGSSKSD